MNKMRIAITWTFILGLWTFTATRPAQAQVMINEVMPDTTAANDASEWIELFNYTSEPVDLRGWKLDAQMITGVDSVTIPAFGYFILTKDTAAFTNEFGSQPNLIGIPISLRNSNDEVILENSNINQVIDRLTYASVSSGKSWQRKGLSCTEAVSQTPSLGLQNPVMESNCFPETVQLPAIEFSVDSMQWRSSLTTIGPVEIFVRLTGVDASQISDLKWRRGGDDMNTPLRIASGLEQAITAEFKLNNQLLSLTNSQLNIIPKLIITEFLPDPEGSDNGHEWIEIYNPNSFAVEHAGYIVTANNDIVLTLPAGSINPGSYKQVALPGSHLRNCSQQCNNSIALKFNELTVDDVTYSLTEAGRSWSKSEDGWRLDYPLSPGAMNEAFETTTTVASVTSQTTMTVNSVTTSAVIARSVYRYGLPMQYSITRAEVKSEGWKLDQNIWMLGLGLSFISLGSALLVGLRLNTTGVDHPVQVPILS